MAVVAVILLFSLAALFYHAENLSLSPLIIKEREECLSQNSDAVACIHSFGDADLANKEPNRQSNKQAKTAQGATRPTLSQF